MLSTSTQVSRATTAFEIVERRLFLKFLDMEQKRTERSQRRFVLMLLESESLLSDPTSPALGRIGEVLSQCTRETDLTGWYEGGTSLGIIFTEIGWESAETAADTLLTKIDGALANALSPDQYDQLRISCYMYPEDWENGSSNKPAGAPLIRVQREQNLKSSGFSGLAKRSIDIAGSLLALIVLSPLLLAIAIAIKVTSEGPVLFRQKRHGRYGRPFTFLKFRSMYVQNDHTIHKEYVKRLILGDKELEKTQDGGKKVFKLTSDPRITKIGRFLRRASLDELPQFINVLRGEMSLVGPRPPIPYEVEHYSMWHKRRLYEAKPGITGLWQVRGRSRTTFDEMVRLDLEYSRSWSLWLDFKILFQTPAAVFRRDGAY